MEGSEAELNVKRQGIGGWEAEIYIMEGPEGHEGFELKSECSRRHKGFK